jgi:hypothetical protein
VKLENMEKYGNKASISTQKIRTDTKSNNDNRAESPRWPDYEDESFKDETIGYIGEVFNSLETKWILGIELGANSVRREISITSEDMMM